MLQLNTLQQLNALQTAFGLSDEEMFCMIASGYQCVEEIRAVAGLSALEERSHATHLAYKQQLIQRLFPAHHDAIRIEHTPLTEITSIPQLVWISEREQHTASRADYAWTLHWAPPTGSVTYAAYSLRPLLFYVTAKMEER